MRVWWPLRRGLIGLLVVVVLPCALVACEWGWAWRQRRVAERTLRELAAMHLTRATTEAEVLRSISGTSLTPVEANQNELRWVGFGVPNFPIWVGAPLRWLDQESPGYVNGARGWGSKLGMVFDHVLPHPELFQASFQFDKQGLSELVLRQGDGVFGFMGGYAAVSMLDMDEQTGESLFLLNGEEFHGFRISPWTSGSPSDIAEVINVDPRATAEQRRAALNFRLECFTELHGCPDPRVMLHLPVKE